MAIVDRRGAVVGAADPPIGTNPNPDLAIKAPVRVATTGANINLQTIGLGTIDGVALAAGDRVLVKDQTDASTNGLYNASTGPWTRTIDAANNSQWAQGTLVLVTQGAANMNAVFEQTAADPITLGTTALTFALEVGGATSLVSNSKLATAPAWTFKGNPTSGVAQPTDFTIDSLTLKDAPAATDEMVLWDVAAGALKKSTVNAVSTEGGVASIAGDAGAFTLGAGLANSSNVLLIDASYMRGYIAGLTGSSSTLVLTVTAGVATSDDNTTLMKLGSTITKTLGGGWVVGSGNGGLDTGSVAANTWYHVFLIERPDTGVVDVLFSTSVNLPTLPTNYTKQRRIMSVKTDSGPTNILAFFQNGDQFLWNVPPALDINTTNPGTSAVTATVSVPTGVRVMANLNANIVNTAGASNGVVLFTSLDIADTAPSDSATPLVNSGVGVSTVTPESGSQINVQTNTSAQIRYRSVFSSASFTVRAVAVGWVDTRGRFS